ncbi:peptide/nickel transport system permease protein [Paraburkholderia eburnea]|uniref:Peptide/nickel transport system permease protein n=2 Tax=Paraburkholderia eburnea TaxID=1189126 RepID=A0A2S4M9T2_9BURK|nr:peptide/nickel transport system permease protein [Paraburkholderia eburnea]PRZ22554.1 peptide/nickel transport system permease protein [Paraburkholderia eburnea]
MREEHPRTVRISLPSFARSLNMRLSSFRSIGVRLSSIAVTLWLLSVVAFACGHLLPGNVGRAVLGPLADAQAVAELNHQLGTDQPLLVQYGAWFGRLLHGDLGASLVLNEPVGALLFTALGHSLALAGLALLMLLPISIATGVLAATWAGSAFDTLANVWGLTSSVIPEFVWCIVLMLTFGIGLRWLPLFATSSPDAGPLDILRHLLLPAAALGMGLFGYLLRMVRASTLHELHAQYTRTAVLKGLPFHTVVLRHVLRNALQPTIAVIGTQLGYLVGGLVAVEALFRYPGIGSLLLHAAKTRDFPLLQGGMLLVGAVYAVGTTAADLLAAILVPQRVSA